MPRSGALRGDILRPGQQPRAVSRAGLKPPNGNPPDRPDAALRRGGWVASR